MSQIAMIATPGSVAPDLETITADFGGPVGVDAAFNINLLTDGFLTTVGDPATNTITISVNNIVTGIDNTTDATTEDIAAVALGPIPGTYLLESKIVGYEPVTAVSCGYNLICVARTDGFTSSIVSVPDKYNAEDPALAACDANFVAVGNTIVSRVLGVAGLTLDWRATTVYERVF